MTHHEDPRARKARLGAVTAAAIGLIVASPPTRAQDRSFGCKVLLCAAASNPAWLAIPYCVPVMQQLFGQIGGGGGWPGCTEAGTSGGSIGYQPLKACQAGSTYGADPNGSSCATSQDQQNYQTQLDAYNAAQNRTGACPQLPSLQTMQRPPDPNPYYVDLNSRGTTTRFFFSLSPL